MREYTRGQLLALTPDRYLADGFNDAAGRLKPELLTDYALAAATQFLRAELSPQELAYTVAALQQILPMHDGPPPARIEAALEETLSTVSGMIGQPNNEGLAAWCRACAAMVRQPSDIDGFMAHIQAVLRQYAALASLPPPSPDSSPPAPG